MSFSQTAGQTANNQNLHEALEVNKVRNSPAVPF